MVVTEDRLAETKRLESILETPGAPPDAASFRPPLLPSGDWRSLLRGAWIVSILAMIVFQPTPSDADAVIPAWAAVAGLALVMSLGAMFWGMARQRTWAFGVSALAGGIGMALGYECRASGHHLGAWWMVELGVFSALTAASLIALRSARLSARRA